MKVAGVGVPITSGCSSISELSSLGAYGFSGHVSYPGGGKTQSCSSTSLIGPLASFKLPGEPCTNGLLPHLVFRFLISSESDVGVVTIIKPAARITIAKATLWASSLSVLSPGTLPSAPTESMEYSPSIPIMNISILSPASTYQSA